MSTRADIIDLLDNATENSLEKILDAVKKIFLRKKNPPHLEDNFL